MKLWLWVRHLAFAHRAFCRICTGARACAQHAALRARGLRRARARALPPAVRARARAPLRARRRVVWRSCCARAYTRAAHAGCLHAPLSRSAAPRQYRSPAPQRLHLCALPRYRVMTMLPQQQRARAALRVRCLARCRASPLTRSSHQSRCLLRTRCRCTLPMRVRARRFCAAARDGAGRRCCRG